MPADDALFQQGRKVAFEAGFRSLLGLAAVMAFGSAVAADPKPEVIFQLPLAPSGLTVMPDGSFLDANKQPVSDLALRTNLQASYERAKYRTDETKDWGNASD